MQNNLRRIRCYQLNEAALPLLHVPVQSLRTLKGRNAWKPLLDAGQRHALSSFCRYVAWSKRSSRKGPKYLYRTAASKHVTLLAVKSNHGQVASVSAIIPNLGRACKSRIRSSARYHFPFSRGCIDTIQALQHLKNQLIGAPRFVIC